MEIYYNELAQEAILVEGDNCIQFCFRSGLVWYKNDVLYNSLKRLSNPINPKSRIYTEVLQKCRERLKEINSFIEVKI